MTQIVKRFKFEAAHELPWHQGKCQRLHGHSYKFEVMLEGELNHDGIVVDFDDLTTIVDKMVIKRYDHQCLNAFFPNPTAEVLAESIFKSVALGMEKNEAVFYGVKIVGVRLWETENCSVTYYEENYHGRA